MSESNNHHHLHQKLNKSLSDTDLMVDDSLNANKDLVKGGSVNSVPDTIKITNDNDGNNDSRSNCTIM